MHRRCIGGGFHARGAAHCRCTGGGEGSGRKPTKRTEVGASESLPGSQGQEERWLRAVSRTGEATTIRAGVQTTVTKHEWRVRTVRTNLRDIVLQWLRGFGVTPCLKITRPADSSVDMPPALGSTGSDAPVTSTSAKSATVSHVAPIDTPQHLLDAAQLVLGLMPQTSPRNTPETCSSTKPPPRKRTRRACEDCGAENPSYGMRSEGVKRWCANCA